MYSFLRSHLLIPLALVTIALVVDAWWSLDLRLSDTLFTWEGDRWALHHNWFTETLVHSGGRILTGIMLATLLLTLGLSFLLKTWRKYRSGLVYLITTILISLALINGLKAVSGVPCPWDVTRYGGNAVLQHWFTGFTGHYGCFPAGHASGGYVWVALYFFALAHCFKRRYQTLATGITLGLIFGIAQQLRGAHFLSHDLVTLGICWFTSLFGFLLWFGQNVGTIPGYNPMPMAENTLAVDTDTLDSDAVATDTLEETISCGEGKTGRTVRRRSSASG